MSNMQFLMPESMTAQLPDPISQEVQALIAGFSGKTTLEQVLSDAAFLDVVGRQGELSGPQKTAVAATVASMQDRIVYLMGGMIQILQRQAEQRERSLALALGAGVWTTTRNLWNAPMFRSAQLVNEGDDDNVGGQRDNSVNKLAISTRLSALLTWGNFFAFAAAALMGVALYTTHAYSNFKDLADMRKDQVEAKDKEIGRLQVALGEANDERDEAKTNAAMAEAQATGYQKQLDAAIATQGGDAKDLQEEVKRLNTSLTTAEVKAAETRIKLENATKELVTYKEAYNTQFQRANKAERDLDQLQQYVTSLKEKGVIR